MALVSVILPTRDRPALLPRAVRSVLAQEGADFEVVVIDSNRQSRPVIEAHAGAEWLSDTRLRVITAGKAANAAAARNVGLTAVASEWITYLDDDDVYRQGKLARQLDLAQTTGATLVLCGAEFFLRQRRRVVQVERSEWKNDELILRARWNTPLLMHRHPGAARFDETLSPGEDAEFAHRLLARANAPAVPVASAALVEIHPQSGPRVNSNPQPMRAAAARILAQRPKFYSRTARRRFVLQMLLGEAKLRGQTWRCLRLSIALLRESVGNDWRVCANALAVSTGVLRGRWVS